MSTVLPEKTYFKIGEAAGLVGVKPYIIRYWETEFRTLKPAKTKSRQRLFRHRDIFLLLVIKKLLYEQKFTIEGARRRMKELSAAGLQVEEMLTAIDAAPVEEDAVALRAQVEQLTRELETAKATRTDQVPDDDLAALLQRSNEQVAELEQELSDSRRDAKRAQDIATDAQRGTSELEANLSDLRADQRQRWLRLQRDIGIAE
ncbi:MAG: DNA-binding transcriptional MerR regulator [Bradymonadia bacterium]|jgi:DNA-binding transcriptional MerR regulator